MSSGKGKRCREANAAISAEELRNKTKRTNDSWRSHTQRALGNRGEGTFQLLSAFGGEFLLVVLCNLPAVDCVTVLGLLSKSYPTPEMVTHLTRAWCSQPKSRWASQLTANAKDVEEGLGCTLQKSGRDVEEELGCHSWSNGTSRLSSLEKEVLSLVLRYLPLRDWVRVVRLVARVNFVPPTVTYLLHARARMNRQWFMSRGMPGCNTCQIPGGFASNRYCSSYNLAICSLCGAIGDVVSLPCDHYAICGNCFPIANPRSVLADNGVVCTELGSPGCLLCFQPARRFLQVPLFILKSQRHVPNKRAEMPK